MRVHKTGLLVLNQNNVKSYLKEKHIPEMHHKKICITKYPCNSQRHKVHLHRTDVKGKEINREINIANEMMMTRGGGCHLGNNFAAKSNRNKN